jgi:rod shape determining protein RodA
MSFIYPSEYDDETMQQENSVMAIGSGKLTGKGLINDDKNSSATQTNLVS